MSGLYSGLREDTQSAQIAYSNLVRRVIEVEERHAELSAALATLERSLPQPHNPVCPNEFTSTMTIYEMAGIDAP